MRAAAGLFESNVFPDDLNDVDRGFDLLQEVHVRPLGVLSLFALKQFYIRMYFDVRRAGSRPSRGIQAFDRAEIARGPLSAASPTAAVAVPRIAIAGDHDFVDGVLSGVDEAGQRRRWA